MKRSSAVAFLLAAVLGTSGVARTEGFTHLTVTDRLGRDVPASVCAVKVDGCAAIAARPIPIPGTDLLVRISAPGFETLETRLAPGEHAVKLKSKGSVSASFASTEKNQEWTAEISLARDENGKKGRNVESKKTLLPKAPEAKAMVFEDVPTGDYWLAWEGPQIAAEAIRVQVKEPTHVAAGKFEVRGGLSVRGFVRDPSGSPIPEAEIRFSDPTRIAVSQAGWKASTSTSGEFSLAGLPISRLEWRVTRKGFVETHGTWSGEPSFDVSMEKAQLITGRVVDERKEPIPGVRIHASFRFNSGSRGATIDPTRPDGTFELYRHAPGDLSLRFSAQRFLVTELKVPDDKEKALLDLGEIVLSRGRTLSGVVLDAATGQHVDGATVSVSGSTAVSTTSDGGRFTLESVPDSDVTVGVTAAGYARTQFPVSKTSSDARIPLTRGGTLDVRVCGTSAELAELGIVLTTTTKPGLRLEREANGKGEFKLENMTPGEHLVWLQWKVKGAQSGWLGFQSVAETSNASVRIEDGQTAKVSFRCDGLPVAGVINRAVSSASPVWGVLRNEKDRWITEFRADESGRFSTRVPVPDRYLFHVFFPDGLKAVDGEFCVVPQGGKTDCAFTVGSR